MCRSIQRSARPNEPRGRSRTRLVLAGLCADGRGKEMARVSPEEIIMGASEKQWWERVRSRGSFWYIANKGLAFLVLYPLLGCGVIGWTWTSSLLLEGWIIGAVCGGFVWMRKELRYRFTLDREDLVVSNRFDE